MAFPDWLRIGFNYPEKSENLENSFIRHIPNQDDGDPDKTVDLRRYELQTDETGPVRKVG